MFFQNPERSRYVPFADLSEQDKTDAFEASLNQISRISNATRVALRCFLSLGFAGGAMMAVDSGDTSSPITPPELAIGISAVGSAWLRKNSTHRFMRTVQRFSDTIASDRPTSKVEIDNRAQDYSWGFENSLTSGLAPGVTAFGATAVAKVTTGGFSETYTMDPSSPGQLIAGGIGTLVIGAAVGIYMAGEKGLSTQESAYKQQIINTYSLAITA